MQPEKFSLSKHAHMLIMLASLAVAVIGWSFVPTTATAKTIGAMNGYELCGYEPINIPYHLVLEAEKKPVTLAYHN